MSVEAIDETMEETADVVPIAPNMPPAITTAVIEVMGAVRKLERDDRNKHQNYDFTSADKFFEVVGGVCAKAGLFILQDESEVEVIPPTEKGKAAWLRVTYEFELAHSSGVALERKFKRTIMVPAAGGQSFGAAQSYTFKQFMRSLFQIATGDKDEIDLGGRTNIDPLRMSPTQRKKAGMWRGPKMITELKKQMTALHKALEDCKSSEDAQKVVDKFDEVLQQCKVDLPEWYSGSRELDGVLVTIREFLPDYDLPPGYRHIDRFGDHITTYRDPLQYVQAIYSEGDGIEIPEAMIALYEYNEEALDAANKDISEEDSAKYYQPLAQGYETSRRAVDKKDGNEK